jgi:hypothetical protein
VTSESEWERAVAVCRDQFGAPSVLFNNAGVYAVEMKIARLAARRADDDDFASMRESIELLGEHMDDRRMCLHYDHLFHYAMGRATGSDLLAHYQHQILKRLIVLWPEYSYEEEDPVLVTDLHRRTLAALVRRREANRSWTRPVHHRARRGRRDRGRMRPVVAGRRRRPGAVAGRRRS